MSDSFTRSATLEDVKALVQSLNDHGAEYLLIGGYALLAHGYARATTDIDILVRAEAGAGELVKRALLVLPDQAARDIDAEWFDEGENIRVADEIAVDVMMNANGQTYESLVRYLEVIDLDGIPVRTVSLEGLLLTKQTPRPKDIGDRILLERAIAARKDPGRA